VAHVPDTWLPEAAVNGTRLDFDRWPISESPYLTSAEGVLEVNDGHNAVRIDWRGQTPAYTYYELAAGGRRETGRR
jgi:hypothetical protein